MKKEHSYNGFNENLVKIEGDKIYTTSLDVARVFDKRHDNVIQAIKNLDVKKNSLTLILR